MVSTTGVWEELSENKKSCTISSLEDTLALGCLGKGLEKSRQGEEDGGTSVDDDDRWALD